ncbi:MAG: nucleoside recognition domain-containing protein, partial [Polyangiales bacterium]
RGLSIDVATLSERLGVPVVAASALREEGIDVLRRAMIAEVTRPDPATPVALTPLPCAPKFSDDLEAILATLEVELAKLPEVKVAPRAWATLLLAGDPSAIDAVPPSLGDRVRAAREQIGKTHGMPALAVLNRARLQAAQRLVRDVQRKIDPRDAVGEGAPVWKSTAFAVGIGLLAGLVVDGAKITLATIAAPDPLADYGVGAIFARATSSALFGGWSAISIVFGVAVGVVAGVVARSSASTRIATWKAALAWACGYIAYFLASGVERLARGHTGFVPVAIGATLALATLTLAAASGPHRDVAALRWFGHVTMRPIAGLPFLAAALLLAYEVVGVFGAGTAVDWLENGLFGSVIAQTPLSTTTTADCASIDEGTHRIRVSPRAGSELVDVFAEVRTGGVCVADTALALTVDGARHGVEVVSREPAHLVVKGYLAGRTAKSWQGRLNVGAFRALDALGFDALTNFLVGPYGLLTMGLTYAIAIVLPVVATFFFVFSILEDSGYLPRLAVMANRGMRTIGLNGKAVLPMILGLGCDTMATLTAR